ncbi:MAG: hypothetical protein RIR08_1352, partial [Pseudomonadota bacterium]
MLVALSCVSLPTMAFEPLNTDDAGTIGKNVNQIEQYFYDAGTIGKNVNQIEQYFYVLHNNVAGNPGGTATPGEEFRGIGNAKAFPLTYTYGLSESTEMSLATTYYSIPRGSYAPFANNILG